MAGVIDASDSLCCFLVVRDMKSSPTRPSQWRDMRPMATRACLEWPALLLELGGERCWFSGQARWWRSRGGYTFAATFVLHAYWSLPPTVYE